VRDRVAGIDGQPSDTSLGVDVWSLRRRSATSCAVWAQNARWCWWTVSGTFPAWLVCRSEGAAPTSSGPRDYRSGQLVTRPLRLALGRRVPQRCKSV